VPATRHCDEPVETSPYHRTVLLQDPLQCYSHINSISRGYHQFTFRNIIMYIFTSQIHLISPANLIILYLNTITRFDKQFKLMSFSFCNFLYPPVTSHLLSSNVHLSTLLSNILSLLTIVPKSCVFHKHTSPIKLIISVVNCAVPCIHVTNSLLFPSCSY
jgi:hypothetical protein